MARAGRTVAPARASAYYPRERRQVTPERGAVCAKIHSLLVALPPFHDPDEVPFDNGLYFFYENGEKSDHGPEGRIVRIGNHPRSQHRLHDRLWDHYSPNKNFSVFRKLLGGALLRREDPRHPCLAPAPGKGHWEKQDESPCPLCRPLEQRVTAQLHGTFRFRCVAIEDRESRNALEKKLIGSVSVCLICRPSGEWLGRYAYSRKVTENGLWNSNHVGGPDGISAWDLVLLKKLVAHTLTLLSPKG